MNKIKFLRLLLCLSEKKNIIYCPQNDLVVELN